jgi:hypothetical protein
MNELKNTVYTVIAVVVWSAACVCAGFLLSNAGTAKQFELASADYIAKQQEYERRIEQSVIRINDNVSKLSQYQSVIDAGTLDLQRTLAEIRKQELVLQDNDDGIRTYSVSFSSGNNN